MLQIIRALQVKFKRANKVVQCYLVVCFCVFNVFFRKFIYMLWSRIFIDLKFLKPAWFIFPFVSDYDHSYESIKKWKPNRLETFSPNENWNLRICFHWEAGKSEDIGMKTFSLGTFYRVLLSKSLPFPGLGGEGDLLWLVHINETIIWLLFTHLHASKKRFDSKICILLVVSLCNI